MNTPSTLAEQRSRLISGLSLMSVAMLFLPAMDAVAKLVSGTVSAGQTTWARFMFQALFTLPFLVAFEGWRALIPNKIAGNAVRGILLAVASCGFFATLKYMPLADALAIFFVEPFFLTVLSAAIEKEHVGWQRVIALAIGFGGALLIIQPSYGVFGPVALLPLASALIFAIYLLLNRRLAPYDSALSMQFSGGVGGMLTMSILLASGWASGFDALTPSVGSGGEWLLLALMGLLGAIGHLMVVAAFRRAPAPVLAPFQYLEIVGAAAYGYMLFGDFPDGWKLVGIIIIVGSGAYVFWRESRDAKGTEQAA